MNIYNFTKKKIISILNKNFKNIAGDIASSITCEQPKNQSFGDISTNVVMLILKKIKQDKKNISNTFIKHMLANKEFKKVEFVEPGFLNIYFTNTFWLDFIREIYLKKKNYGFYDIGKNKTVNIEFVSANPTGPLHVGHLRGAIFGDVLSKLLSKTGYRVDKEYYVNDVGKQVDNLALTVDHHIKNITSKKDVPLSENMYKGKYLKDIAEDLVESNAFDLADFEKLKEYSLASNMKLISKDLQSIGVKFDKFSYEKKIHRNGTLEKAINELSKKKHIYYGILEKPKGKKDLNWRPVKQMLFKSSIYGDKSDRVIKKDDGSWTYFASDIAYHYDKAKRGYTEIINVWGADHAGYIDRVKASLNALGFKKITFTVKLCQIVNLIDKKKVIKMSKREGNFILVSDLLPKIGKDVLRFFMLTRKNDAHLDFDLEKCINESNENPSFYVQYAYARICSLKKIAKVNKIKLDDKNINKISNSLLLPEIGIIRCLSLWPKIIESATIRREPHRIVYYLIDLAGKFHTFWSLGKSDENYKIVTGENSELTQIRLLLIELIQSVIKNGLDLLSVSAREKM